MELSYFQSIDAAQSEIGKLRAALAPHYADRLKLGLGKAGQGYASYHAVLDGITYGRVTFKNGELYNVKHYKPEQYPFDEKDPGEFLFLRIKTFYAKGAVLSYREIHGFLKEARALVVRQLEEAQRYRDENPAAHRRKKLRGKNVRFVLRDILANTTQRLLSMQPEDF
jgi:hypothetical protein